MLNRTPFLVLLLVFLTGVVPLFAAGPGGTTEMDFSLSFSASHTDNRDSLDTDAAEDNLAIHIKPKIDALLDRRRTVLGFFYAPSWRYWSNPNEGSQNDTELHQDIGVTLDHVIIKRLKLRVRDVYNVTDDPAVHKDGTAIREDGSYTMNRAYAGLSCLLTKQTMINVAGKNRIKEYEDEKVRPDSDEETSSGLLTFRYEFSDDFVVSVVASYTMFEYETSFDVERGFQSMGYYASVNKDLTGKLSASAQAGWTTVGYDDEELADQDAPFVSARLVLTLSPMTRFSVNGSYSLKDADVFPFASQRNSRMGFNCRHDVGRSGLSLTLAGSYSKGEYEREMASPSAPDEAFVDKREGSEIALSFSGGLEYRISDKQSLRLSQSSATAKADVDVDFDRNTTGFSWKVIF